MDYEFYTMDEAVQIIGSNNELNLFEWKMEFIPFYNKALLEDKSLYNNLLITRMLRIGKKTEFLEEVIYREIGVMIQKKLIQHCWK